MEEKRCAQCAKTGVPINTKVGHGKKIFGKVNRRCSVPILSGCSHNKLGALQYKYGVIDKYNKRAEKVNSLVCVRVGFGF